MNIISGNETDKKVATLEGLIEGRGFKNFSLPIKGMTCASRVGWVEKAIAEDSIRQRRRTF